MQYLEIHGASWSMAAMLAGTEVKYCTHGGRAEPDMHWMLEEIVIKGFQCLRLRIKKKNSV